MGLETILALGGACLGGSIILGAISAPLTYLGGGKRRKEQKKLADQWGLVELYGLRDPQELALHRVKRIAKMLEKPSKRTNYGEEINSVLDDYMPLIAEQSSYFKDSPAETDAFKQFLGDRRTKQWLTDPVYVMSDIAYSWQTSYPGLIINLYADIGTLLRYKITGKEPSPKRCAKSEIILSRG